MDVKANQVVSDVEGEEMSSCPNGDVKPLVTSNDDGNTKTPTPSHSPEMKEIVKEKGEKEDTKIRLNNTTTKSKKELEVDKKLEDVKDEESTEEEDGDSTEEENSNDFSDDDDVGGSSKSSGNTWECSVCTYHNSAEAFKCLMCEVRRGTSTRKPRFNPQVVALQVAKQQAQIQQQLLKQSQRSHEKKIKSSTSSSLDSSRGGLPPPLSPSTSSTGAASTSSEATNHTTIGSSSSSVKRRNSDGDLLSPLPGSSKGSVKDSSLAKKAKKSSVSNMSDDDVQRKKTKKKPATEEDKNGKTKMVKNPANKKSLTGERGRPTKIKASKLGKVTSQTPSSLKVAGKKSCITKAITVNNVTVIITEFTAKSAIGKKKSPPKSKSNNKGPQATANNGTTPVSMEPE